MATQPTLMTIFQAKNNPNRLIRAHQAQFYNRFDLISKRFFYFLKIVFMGSLVVVVAVHGKDESWKR